MVLVMVNERSEKKKKQMDCPEGQGTKREGAEEDPEDKNAS